MKSLRENHENDLGIYFWTNDHTFSYLLDKVRPRIERKDSEMGKAISVEQRLATKTRYLATGRSLEDVKFSTLVLPQALDHIIPET